MKKIVLILFVVILSFDIQKLQAQTITSGTCGDNCTWDITDGVLTISGTGPMTDYSTASPAPWNSQRTSITDVQISDAITSIGTLAFAYATNLTNIAIPDSVTSIGNSAFSGAISLTGIHIPNSVTSIKSYAFSSTTSLTDITIPDSVKSIGIYAFSGATSLTRITIPDSIILEVKESSGANPFTDLDLSKVTLYCAGVLAQCQADMLAAGYADGTYNMVQAPYSKKQADGSRAYYDANGKFIGYKGKRIYTLDEANRVAGDKNRVSIKYR